MQRHVSSMCAVSHSGNIDWMRKVAGEIGFHFSGWLVDDMNERKNECGEEEEEVGLRGSWSADCEGCGYSPRVQSNSWPLRVMEQLQ